MARPGLLALAALVALVAGCGSPAEDYVEDAAESVRWRLTGMRGDDPLALAHAAESRGAEVLAYGTTGGQGAAVEVRITRTEEPAGLDSGSTATRCYRFTHDGSQVDQDRIDCDGRVALLLPEMPLPPSLPAGLDEGVLTALSDLAAGGVTDEAAVRDAVVPLAGGPPVVVAVATAQGDVGVAVHVPGQCLFGRISGGAATVWHVPRVLAQPGELGCGPVTPPGARAPDRPTDPGRQGADRGSGGGSSSSAGAGAGGSASTGGRRRNSPPMPCRTRATGHGKMPGSPSTMWLRTPR